MLLCAVMANFKTFALMCSVLLGCSGGDGEDDDSFMCAQSDRSGTYVIHYSERANGTCGEPPDEVARLDGEGGLAPTCALDAPDDWSADGCRLDRSLTCCDGGFCTHVVGFTEQRDDNGETITGVISIRIEEIGASGLVLDSCVSTYDISATRQ